MQKIISLSRFGVLSVLFILKGITFGQNIDSDTTHLGNVEVVTTYKPDVAESKKIGIRPKLENPKVDPPNYKYEFPTVAYKPKAVYAPIDPVFIKPEPAENLFDNYIEIGGGNYLTSYLDASIHNTQDKYYSYGLKAKHHAANASKNPEQGLFSQNQIKAYGLREKGNDLYGAIDYKRNVVHYYGYLLDSTALELNDINQIYNDVESNLVWSIKKSKVQSELDFAINVFDKLGENETSFGVSNKNVFKRGKNGFHLDIDGLFSQLNESDVLHRLFIDFKPHLEFDYKKWTLDAGLNMSYINGFDSATTDLNPYPYLRAETYLVPKLLRLYFGADGGYVRNTLKSISYENLFLGNNFELNTPSGWSIHGGMNGSFKRFVEYGIKVKQDFVQDQFFFVSDTNELRNFTTVESNLNRTIISGELKLDIHKNLNIGFRGNLYSYDLETETEAWHLPTYDAALTATLKLVDKIYVKGSYFATSSRPIRDISGKIDDDLDAINDINIGAEYRYKKNISGFLNINNILNQRYDLWNNYRAQGLNVLAGVTFSL